MRLTMLHFAHQLIDYRTERNLVEAAAVGASTSISLVANIAANLIAFLGLLAFVNSSIQWFGSFVGYPDLTFDVRCVFFFYIF